MLRIKTAVWWGLITALLGVLVGMTPVGARLEKDLGLRLLFRLRGPRPAPAEVVVVDMDRVSAETLGLPFKLSRWPRSLHGRLVTRLTELGARVVAFDVVFEEARDAGDDRQFARAVAAAGNVVLCQYLQEDRIALRGDDGASLGSVRVTGRVPVLPELAEAALAVAPFLLPKVPVRLNQAWYFRPGAGDEPTLPVVALQVHSLDLYPRLRELLAGFDDLAMVALPANQGARDRPLDVSTLTRQLREILQHRPDLAHQVLGRIAQSGPQVFSEDQRRRLRALIRMYGGTASAVINYYGPPRSIRTLSYHQVLSADPDDAAQRARLDLAGRAVFVGVAERLRHNQEDAFYTVYSRDDGTDIGGVEIGATLFANLLEASGLQPAGGWVHLVLLVGWGLLMGGLCLLSPLVAVLSMGMAGAGLLCGAEIYFSRLFVWLPVATPLFVQAPAAFVGTLVWKHFRIDRERKNIRDAFGYYLPARVVNRLAQDLSHLHTDRRRVYGICLCSDAQQYTRLAESFSPDELHALMNRYYEAVFAPITAHGGTVSDVVGDSVLALWAAAEPRQALKEQACRAALEILAAVEQFKVSDDIVGMPTRIGIHAGHIVMGNVGAGEHFEYRPVGDIVNTASRLESLNKQLGTRLIVSEEMCTAAEGLLTRPLGTFLMAGKTRPVTVREVLGPSETAGERRHRMLAQFAEGLAAARASRWEAAVACFQQTLHLDPNDGPAKFYLNLCQQYGKTAQDHTWNGIVTLESK